jgi:hypothetical protein
MAQSERPWLIGVFITSGAIVLTYLGTYIQGRQQKHVDLRLVPGNPRQQQWHIGAVGTLPTMSVIVAMNVAHDTPEKRVCIKHAYLSKWART